MASHSADINVLAVQLAHLLDDVGDFAWDSFGIVRETSDFATPRGCTEKKGEIRHPTYLRNEIVLQNDLHTPGGLGTEIGHTRDSTREQSKKIRFSRLAEAGRGMFFEEKVSGTVSRRPRLEAMLERLRKDDMAVVTKFDRLAPPTIELLRMTEVLNENSAGIQAWVAFGPPSIA